MRRYTVSWARPRIRCSSMGIPGSMVVEGETGAGAEVGHEGAGPGPGHGHGPDAVLGNSRVSLADNPSLGMQNLEVELELVIHSSTGNFPWWGWHYFDVLYGLNFLHRLS